MNLYKKNRIWSITKTQNGIHIEYGVIGGKMIVKDQVVISDEVDKKIQSLIDKKINRECYSFDKNSEPTFIQPQLANSKPIPKNYIISPKLDGVRAIWRPDLKKFQSRKGVLYNVPHLEEIMKNCSSVLDGELYKHGVTLNRILGSVRKFNNITDSIEFHVFDVVDDSKTFLDRIDDYTDQICKIQSDFVIKVPQNINTSIDLHDHYVKQGYEGVVGKNPLGYYAVGKRNNDTLKFKVFKDAEWKILDIIQDVDGGAVVKLDGFSARPVGSLAHRKSIYSNRNMLIGKQATIKYFEMSEYGIPLQPICKLINRD